MSSGESSGTATRVHERRERRRRSAACRAERLRGAWQLRATPGGSGLERYRGRRRRFWPGRGAWAASGRVGGETTTNGVSREEDGGDGSFVNNSKFKLSFCKLNFSPF